VDDFRVELDAYTGPLDLLLYLVRRDEVDITNLPIARLTDAYLRYLDLLKVLRVDVAGEFLVMAATLMEIKSRSLLPAPPEPEDEDWEDPCEELVRRLMEYRRFKEAAMALGEQADLRARQVARPGEKPRDAPDSDPDDLRDVSLWDLLEAFSRLLAATGAPPTAIEVVYDDTPQEEVMRRILTAFDAAPGRPARREVPLEDLAERPLDRGVVVSLILAILELVKQGVLRAVQHEPFGKIYLVHRREAPSPARAADGTTPPGEPNAPETP